MPIRNVQVTEHYDHFIDASVDSGRFSDADELVGEGLRLLERQEAEDGAKLEWLQNAVKEGMDSLERGETTTLRTRQEIKEFVAAISAKRLSVAK